MQGNVANGWAVLALLVSMAAAWWWAHRQLSISAQRKQRGKARRFVALILGGLTAAFGMFCLAGAILLPDPTQGAHIMGVFGALVLAPFAWLWWRNRTAPTTKDAIAQTHSPFNPTRHDPSTTVKPISFARLDAAIAPAAIAPTSAAHAPTDHADSSKTTEATAATTAAELSAPVAPTTQLPRADEPAPEKISLPSEFSFFYEDHHGERSRRTVRVTDVGTNGAQKYLEGFCLSRQATRTFRTDRITSDLTDQATGEVVTVARLLRDVQRRTAVTFTPTSTGFKRNDQATQRIWETAVFFAGFRGGKLEELEVLASSAGWQVRGSITSTVDYVVFNGSAGKAQLAKADSLGIPVIDEDAFRGLV